MAVRILDELVELMGHQHAIELLRAFGGRRINIPKSIEQDHPLAFTVGLESARKLSGRYGGGDVDLPAERNFLIDLRNGAILDGFKQGRTILWLADTYGVSRRQVTCILDNLGQRELRLQRALR